MNRKTYPCHYCDKVFKFKSVLGKHLVVHTRERRFACDICEVKYAHKFQLTHHKKTKHEYDLISFHCDICDLTVDDADFMRDHLKSHGVVEEISLEKYKNGSTSLYSANAGPGTRSGSTKKNLTKRGSFYRVPKMRTSKRVTPKKNLPGESSNHENKTIFDTIQMNGASWEGEKDPPLVVMDEDFKINSKEFEGIVPDEATEKVYFCDACDTGFRREYALKDHMLTCHGVCV